MAFSSGRQSSPDKITFLSSVNCGCIFVVVIEVNVVVSSTITGATVVSFTSFSSIVVGSVVAKETFVVISISGSVVVVVVISSLGFTIAITAISNTRSVSGGIIPTPSEPYPSVLGTCNSKVCPLQVPSNP